MRALPLTTPLASRPSPLALSFTLTLALAGGCASPHGDGPVAGPTTTSALTCAPGTRPVAFDAACAAVGTTSTPDGFVARRDGWGFEAVVPAAPCTGATRARLGATACEPLDGDGDARATTEFPPAAATILVTTTASRFAGRAGLEVYATLDEALAHASRGATIAVDEGTYETAPVTVSVHIVGRGAAVTQLHGGDFGFQLATDVDVAFSHVAFTGAAKVVLLVNKNARATLDHVYFNGENDGAIVGNGASLTITESAFQGPAVATRSGATNGLHVTYGGHATLRDVELRGYQNALYAESVGSTLAVARSVITEQRGSARDPEGTSQLGAFLGASVTVDQSLIASEKGRVAVVGAPRFDGTVDPTSPGNPPAKVVITASSLVHSLLPRETGSALDAVDGATLSLDDVTLTHECYVGVGATDDANVTLAHAVVVGGASAQNARIAVQLGAGKAHATIDGSALLDATQFAISATTGDVTVKGSLVTGTREVGRFDVSTFMGAGQAVSMGPGAQLDLEDSALVANASTSLSLTQATAKVERAVVRGTRSTAFAGITSAVVSRDSVLSIADSEIADNGIAFALAGGRALVRKSAVADHREAFRLDGVKLVVTDDPSLEAAPSEVVAAASRFERNASMSLETSLNGE